MYSFDGIVVLWTVYNNATGSEKNLILRPKMRDKLYMLSTAAKQLKGLEDKLPLDLMGIQSIKQLSFFMSIS